MGNEQIGQAPLHLELFQQVEDLGTDGHIQRGDGLVGHNKLRLHDDGTGQAHTLALAAGKLVGVTGQMLRQQTYIPGDLLDLGNAVLLILVQVKVIQALGNDILNGGTLV